MNRPRSTAARKNVWRAGSYQNQRRRGGSAALKLAAQPVDIEGA
jgi:hypothetical protein